MDLQGIWIYWLGLALAAAWHWRRRRASVPRLFAYWWAGLLLARVLPLPLHVFAASSPAALRPGLEASYHLLRWIGHVLILRGILGLTFWQRPFRRRTWFALGGLLLGVLVAPAASEALPLVLLVCGIPWMASVRWHRDRSAGALLGLSALGFLAFLLSIVTPNLPLWRAGDHGGSPILHAVTAVLSGSCGIASFFAAASRIHLSIHRVGARLITSHILAGVVPVALVSLFLLIAGSLYLSTYRGQVASRALQQVSAQATDRLRDALARGAPPDSSVFGPEFPGQVLLILADGNPIQVTGGELRFPAGALLSQSDTTPGVPLLFDGAALWLRARVDATQAGRPVRVEALAPLDSVHTSRVGWVLGSPLRITPRTTIRRSTAGLQIGGDDEEALVERASRLDSLAKADRGVPAQALIAREDSLIEAQVEALEALAEDLQDEADSLRGTGVSGAALRAALATAASESLTAYADSLSDMRFPNAGSVGTNVLQGSRIPGGAVVNCLRWRRGEFTTREVPVLSNAGWAEPIASLVTVARTNPLATVALIGLGFIAVLLLGAVWTTIGMVLGMLRSVTRAVHELKRAATAIGQGKLDHRITVAGQDELWSVAASFNEMAAGLERVRGVELENQRLEQELSLAREIQNRLLPTSAPATIGFDIAGLSVPAREVGGDYFDYIPLDGGLVGIAVADVSGKGAAAALLMSSFRASLRSSDLATLGPAETLARLNKFVHSSVKPGKFITAFLGILDPGTGDLRYSCAGHEPPLIISPGGAVEALSAGGLLLGLFPQAEYEEAVARMPKGALLAVFTDGVTEAQSPEGEFYGDSRLLAALTSTNTETCPKLLDRILRALKDFAGGAAQFDDITMVLARRL